MAKTPPSPFPDFNVRILPAGSEFVRIHDPAYEGAAFNPCRGGQTRFAPLRTKDGVCVPTLYAAETLEAAAAESVFHDMPHTAADKFVPLSRVTSRAVSWIETTTDLKLASLNEPDLNRLGLTRSDLVDTSPIEYATTARWAEAFHLNASDLSGLVWTSRRCDPAQAFVLFGDRAPANALTVRETIRIDADPRPLMKIREFGKRCGITLSF